MLEEVDQHALKMDKIDIPEKYAQAYLFRLIKLEKKITAFKPTDRSYS